MGTYYKVKETNETCTETKEFTIMVYRVEDEVVRAVKTDKKGEPTTSFVNYTAKDFQSGIRLGSVERL